MIDELFRRSSTEPGVFVGEFSPDDEADELDSISGGDDLIVVIETLIFGLIVSSWGIDCVAAEGLFMIGTNGLDTNLSIFSSI